MSEEKLHEKLDQLTGGIKEGFGKLTDDAKTQTEGLVQKTVAKGKELVDDAKDAVEGAKDAVEDAIKGIKDTLK